MKSLWMFSKEMMGTRNERKTIKLNRISKKTFPLQRIVDQPQIDFDIKHITKKTMYKSFKRIDVLHHFIRE